MKGTPRPAITRAEGVGRSELDHRGKALVILSACSARDLAMSTAARTDKLVQPNAQNQYEITIEDLPLSCPMPGMYLWNSHPRVYLPIEKSGWAKCSYCSAEYTLKR
jgi:uncharacterized Zn-finger protein